VGNSPLTRRIALFAQQKQTLLLNRAAGAAVSAARGCSAGVTAAGWPGRWSLAAVNLKLLAAHAAALRQAPNRGWQTSLSQPPVNTN
jgi:hypothetical protein